MCFDLGEKVRHPFMLVLMPRSLWIARRFQVFMECAGVTRKI
jgi:hypothetical protein